MLNEAVESPSVWHERFRKSYEADIFGIFLVGVTFANVV